MDANFRVPPYVFAKLDSRAEEMLVQGQEMFAWIPNAYVKYPCTREGLLAAEMSVQEGIRVNITLCFSHEPAAGVYAATRGTAARRRHHCSESRPVVPRGDRDTGCTNRTGDRTKPSGESKAVFGNHEMPRAPRSRPHRKKRSSLRTPSTPSGRSRRLRLRKQAHTAYAGRKFLTAN